MFQQQEKLLTQREINAHNKRVLFIANTVRVVAFVIFIYLLIKP